jgi:hypothetical protein
VADRLEWESLLTSVRHELPQPVAEESVRDGSVVLVGGNPGEVVVRLTRSMASVSEYAVEADGPNELVVRPVLFGSVQWRRMPEVHALASLNVLIRAARDARRSTYRACARCNRLTAPERMFEDGVCVDCEDSTSDSGADDEVRSG